MSIQITNKPGTSGTSSPVGVQVGLAANISFVANSNILFDTIINNFGGGSYSTVTGAYTVPVAGTYLVQFGTLPTTGNSMHLEHNGTNVTRIGQSGGNYCFGGGSVLCAAGDTIAIQYEVTTTITTGVQYNWMNIFLVH